MENEKRIKEIFTKLKDGHPLWVKNDSAYKDRLEKAFDPFFVELEKLGVAQHFAEALLFFGKEFVDSLREYRETGEIKKKVELATIEDAELIFNTKAVKMTDKELREYKLAQKNNALIYRSVPMSGDKIKIQVLAYKEKRIDKQQSLI